MRRLSPEIEGMELSGALSNPRLKVELKGLSDCTSRYAGRPLRSVPGVKRRATPIISTVLQVLKLGDGEPMKLKDIHSACSSLLDTDVSYRALKNGLSDHQRSKHPLVVRAERGLYRLS
jgi:hypothetical protein